MLGSDRPVRAVLGKVLEDRLLILIAAPILPQNLKSEETTRNHGKYKKVKQRRTQEKQANCPQEGQSGKAEEAPRLRARIEKAQGEKAGTRPGEAVALVKHFRAWATAHARLLIGRQQSLGTIIYRATERNPYVRYPGILLQVDRQADFGVGESTAPA